MLKADQVGSMMTSYGTYAFQIAVTILLTLTLSGIDLFSTSPRIMISFLVFFISAILSNFNNSFRIRHGNNVLGLRRGFFFSSISVDGGEILEGSEEIQSLWETSPKIEATINKFTVKDFFQGLHSPSSSSLVGSSASKVFYDEIHGIGQQYLKSANIPHLKDEAWR